MIAGVSILIEACLYMLGQALSSAGVSVVSSRCSHIERST